MALAPTVGVSGADAIKRGATRCLRALEFSAIAELPLVTGRRVDLMAVGPSGEILIVEIKSSAADFQSDLKWTEYRDYCDRFFFAVTRTFTHEIIPENAGLIVGDEYGAELIRESEYIPLSAARRKAILIRFARHSADRYGNVIDSYKSE